LPTTTVVGGVPDSVITGAEVPVAVGGADVPVEPAAALDGELPTPEPHPDRRAETPKQTSKAKRKLRFLAATIRELNYGSCLGANVVNTIHIRKGNR
jgi:hypothetical protein